MQKHHPMTFFSIFTILKWNKTSDLMGNLLKVIFLVAIFSALGTKTASANEFAQNDTLTRQEQDSLAVNKAPGRNLAQTGKKVMRIGEAIGLAAVGTAAVVGAIALTGAAVGVVMIGVAAIAVVSVPIMCVGAVIRHKASKNHPDPLQQKV